MDYGNRRFEYDEVRSFLVNILGSAKAFCKFPYKYRFDAKSNYGTTFSDTLHPVGSRGYVPMAIHIGFKDLTQNMDSHNFVRDFDFVWVVNQAYHECTHLWQRSVVYMQSSNDASDACKYMASEKAICTCFPGFEKTIYTVDSAELFADLRAVSCTKLFFEKKAKHDDRFGEVDVDGILCELCKKKHGVTWPEMMNCTTTEELEKVYFDAILIAPHYKKFDRLLVPGSSLDNRRLSELLQNKGTVEDIKVAKTGIEEAHVLCEYIGSRHPECFRSFPCIKPIYAKNNVRNVIENLTSLAFGITTQSWFDIDNQDDDVQDDSDFQEFY